MLLFLKKEPCGGFLGGGGFHGPVGGCCFSGRNQPESWTLHPPPESFIASEPAAPGPFIGSLALGFFQILTPITYWLLIILWAAILAIYLRRSMLSHWQGDPFGVLLIILAIYAFSSLFESVYFGAWHSSLLGLLPLSIKAALERPEMVFIPKAVNLLAAAVIFFLLVRRWLPREQEAWQSREGHLAELKAEVERRREVEKALKESEARFREMTDMLPVGVAELDLDFNFTYVNQVALDLFGYSREDIQTGLNARKVIHSDDHARLAERVGLVLQGHPQPPSEYRMRARDGRDFVGLIVSLPLRKDGRVAGVRSALLDITSRKHAQIQKEEKVRLEAMIETAGAACHELNQPLQALAIQVELLRQQLINDTKALVRIEDLMTQLNRMANITHQLQSVTQYETTDYMGQAKILDLEKASNRPD